MERPNSEQSVAENSETSGPRIGRSDLGAMIAIASEIMAFAGLCAAALVLGGERLENGAGQASWIAIWMPFCVLGIAYFTSAMARRGVRHGVTLPAHWGANLAVAAGLLWCVVSWERTPGFSGSMPGGPFAQLIAIAILGLGVHVLIALLQTSRSIVAMLGGRHDLAGYLLGRSKLLWMAAAIVQLIVTLAGRV